MTATPVQPAPSPETNRRRGASETNRRGAPRGNRNALKSGRYTAEAKAERKRKRRLLRLLRAGLAYARSVIRARAAAERLFHIPPPTTVREQNFQKSKNNSRDGGDTRILQHSGILKSALLSRPGRRKNFQKPKNNSPRDEFTDEFVSNQWGRKIEPTPHTPQTRSPSPSMP